METDLTTVTDEDIKMKIVPHQASISFDKTFLLYKSALDEMMTKINILVEEFKIMHEYNPIEHVSKRIKAPKSIVKKLQRQNHALTIENVVSYINDLAGIRIVCKFRDDIALVAALIEAQPDIHIMEKKDYITNPKPSGYQSYHMIVTVPVALSEGIIETKVEIQIRTIAMDFWASLEHKIRYKYEGDIPEHIQKELYECAQLVTFLDERMQKLNYEVNDTTEVKEEVEMDAKTRMNELLRLFQYR